MNDIDRWFEKTARREDRTVSLYACLLTGKIFSYFRYRLRFALLLDGTSFVVHVAEFLIILTTLGGLAAFTVMILRVGSLLVSGVWWGLLETMRERLRTLSQAGQRDAVEREIGCWLVLSVIVASAVTIIGGLVLTFWLPPDHDAVGRFYAFLVVIELALRMPVRVLHSGMYATRRIYRPLWTLFAPTVAQLLVLGVGVFVYPAGAIIVAIIVSNAVGIGITVRYTVAAYHLTGLWPKFRAAKDSRRWQLPSIPLRLGAETALSGLGLRLDAVAVLAIAGIYGTNTRAFDLTAGFSGWRDIDAFQFFYLVLPLFRGGYEATNLFYFDFVRLRRIAAFREFRVLFFHKLLWMTPVIAVFFWSLAVALALLVLPDIPFSFVLALLPLFIVRSLIGTYQMRLFGEGQYSTLVASIAFSGGLFALVWIDVNPASDLVEITAAMIVLLIVHINLQHFQDRKPPVPTLLSLGDWIHIIAREPASIRVGRVNIPEWAVSRQRAAAIALMEQTLGGRGCFAFRSSKTLIFYERIASFDERTAEGITDQQPHLALQAMTGGAANRGAFLSEPVANGRDALDRLIEEKWIQPLDGVVAPETPDALRSAFIAIFPDGVFFDLKTSEGKQKMRDVGASVLAGVLPLAMKSLQDGSHVVWVAGRRLSPIFFEGRLRLIFLLPTEVQAEQLQRWLQSVRAWHVGSHNLQKARRAAVS